MGTTIVRYLLAAIILSPSFDGQAGKRTTLKPLLVVAKNRDLSSLSYDAFRGLNFQPWTQSDKLNKLDAAVAAKLSRISKSKRPSTQSLARAALQLELAIGAHLARDGSTGKNQKLRIYKQAARKIFSVLISRAKAPASQTRLRYRAMLLDLMAPQSARRVNNQLSQINPKHLPDDEKFALAFATAGYELLESHGKAQRRQAQILQEWLRRTRATKPQVLARTLLSYSYAQQNPKLLDRSLKLLTLACGRLSDGQKTSVLEFASSLWDSKGSWRSFPLNHKCFRELSSYTPIIEQEALELHKEGNYQQAALKLLEVADRLGNNATAHQTYQRAVQLQLEKNSLTNADFNEKIIAKGIAKFANDAKFVESMHDAYLELLKSKIDSMSLQELVPNPPRILSNFIATNPVSNHQVTAFQVYLDRLERLGKYQIAAGFQEKLAERFPNLRRHFLEGQVENLAQAAGWKFKPEWQTRRLRNRELGQKLISILTELYQTSPDQQKWDNARKLGALHMAFDRTDEAFDLWIENVRREPNTRDAVQALQKIIKHHGEKEQWQPLEEVIYLAIQSGLKSVELDHEVLLTNLLETSLWQNSLGYIEDKAYPKALARLKILETSYQKSPKYSQYLMTLAKTQMTTGQFEQCLSTLENLLAGSQKDPLYSKALFLKAETHIGMGQLDDAITLYNYYLKKFPRDDKIHETRVALIGLLYSTQSKSNLPAMLAKVDLAKLSAETRSTYFNLMTKVYDDNPTKLNEISANILEQPGLKPDLYGFAIERLASVAAESTDVATLERLISFISGSTQLGPLKSSLHAHVLSTHYRLILESHYDEFQVHLVDQNQTALNKLLESLRATSKTLSQLCAPPKTYCNQALGINQNYLVKMDQDLKAISSGSPDPEWLLNTAKSVDGLLKEAASQQEYVNISPLDPANSLGKAFLEVTL